jgi:hypothetical protein
MGNHIFSLTLVFSIFPVISTWPRKILLILTAALGAMFLSGKKIGMILPILIDGRERLKYRISGLLYLLTGPKDEAERRRS